MTPLRARMIEDMTLAGLAPRTQEVYLQAVRRLAAHYKRSPDLLSEGRGSPKTEAHLLVEHPVNSPHNLATTWGCASTVGTAQPT
jgi:Phage integrase, N-terminal SAM-like domain